MKIPTIVTLGAAAQVASAAVVSYEQTPLADQITDTTSKSPVSQTEKYLVELSPFDTLWVTEEEKWELKLVSFCTIVILAR